METTYQQQRNIDSAAANQKASELWLDFEEDEKKLVRFGMFPAAKMERATAELRQEKLDSSGEEFNDAPRLLSVAIMRLAEANGGMIA